MVKMVDAAFNTAASELTMAPNKAASTKPTSPLPGGSIFLINKFNEASNL